MEPGSGDQKNALQLEWRQNSKLHQKWCNLISVPTLTVVPSLMPWQSMCMWAARCVSKAKDLVLNLVPSPLDLRDDSKQGMKRQIGDQQWTKLGSTWQISLVSDWSFDLNYTIFYFFQLWSSSLVSRCVCSGVVFEFFDADLEVVDLLLYSDYDAFCLFIFLSSSWEEGRWPKPQKRGEERIREEEDGWLPP